MMKTRGGRGREFERTSGIKFKGKKGQNKVLEAKRTILKTGGDKKKVGSIQNS